ncbi:lantibiotic dehydratase C-terminal domain-containing protein, partial [Longimicrobium sp.]|uniref:lantibiotic dehydratase C-terminal domain-containing protein n=1 Tax=Longimicrobium sp. TaxID=2029185 RepID=UPI002E33BC6C
PDPTVSASIYANNRLDDVIRGAIAPFRADMARRGGWSLWMVRYARGGAHLKVRLHGPAAERHEVAALLAEHVERCLAAMPEDDGPRLTRPKGVPVDPEDEFEGDYPDRTLLWTRYRRSGVSLGPDAALREDDGYVAHLVTCLAAAADLVIDALAHGDAAPSESARLKILLGAMVSGLTALGFTDEERAAYLAFHRDWMLRFALPDRDREAAVLARYDDRVRAIAPVVEQVIANVERWDADPRAAAVSEAEARWRDVLRTFFDWLRPLRDDPRHPAGPFTQDPAFSPLFKVFHGLGNQLGLDMLNEGLVQHILLRALTGVPAAGSPVLVEA